MTDDSVDSLHGYDIICVGMAGEYGCGSLGVNTSKEHAKKQKHCLLWSEKKQKVLSLSLRSIKLEYVVCVWSCPGSVTQFVVSGKSSLSNNVIGSFSDVDEISFLVQAHLGRNASYGILHCPQKVKYTVRKIFF